MRKALILTIGTELTSGEVINSNAAWVSRQLEDLGVRVFSHLTVRDQADEMARALVWSEAYDLVVVTGGLGPTSDDLTRAAVAAYAGVPLDFDEDIWRALTAVYAERQLPLREAHRHQCWFPHGSERLPNPTGTALGFTLVHKRRPFYVLPGPPRELHAMWTREVLPRLAAQFGLASTTREWRRWTCLGVPESEVAELVEAAIKGFDLEVGYRAQVPYVKVKLFVNPEADGAVITAVEAALAPWLVARGLVDLAEELLQRWPAPSLHIQDEVTGQVLVQRLLAAQSVGPAPRISFGGEPAQGAGVVRLSAQGEEFTTSLCLDQWTKAVSKILPYKVKLSSERGRISAAEWAIWHCVSALRAHSETSS